MLLLARGGGGGGSDGGRSAGAALAIWPLPPGSQPALGAHLGQRTHAKRPPPEPRPRAPVGPLPSSSASAHAAAAGNTNRWLQLWLTGCRRRRVTMCGAMAFIQALTIA